MKKYIYIIALLILIPNTIAQNQWEYTSIPDEILDIKFLDATTGYIIGSQFLFPTYIRVYKTTDKGYSWNEIGGPWGPYYLDFHYNASLDFINENYGYVYIKDQVWKTSNGGGSWQNLNLTLPNSPVCKIRFSDINNGYLISSKPEGSGSGITVYRTTNGQNFYPSAINNLLSNVNHSRLNDINISSTNPNNICVAGYYAQSGSMIPIAYNTNDAFSNYTMINGNYGLLVREITHVRYLSGSTSEIRVLTDKSLAFIDGNSHSVYSYTQLSGNSFLGNGLSLSSANLGFAAYNSSCYSSTNGGTNFTLEFNDGYIDTRNEMNSFGDVAYQGGFRRIFVRKPLMNLNTNFDWHGQNGSIAVDGQNYYTPQQRYIRGGTCNVYALPIIPPPPNSDTTAHAFTIGAGAVMEA